MLDDVDRRLLRQLQAEPTLSVQELAERARTTPARAARRIERMEADGIIAGREALIDWAALGFHVRVSLRITVDKTVPTALDVLMAEARTIPEAIELQAFLGRVDLRLEVIARDMAHYRQVYRERILTLPHVADIEALLTLSTVKHQEEVPV
ncbi:Lrp/AsnC family transcriptional regulator [Pelagovum pacificum]|uniref:Lrp/AsnC family transcriptional regulator n=1 Tax=Pelagovum pacificum TaxID=2588711 RepID=A0A5C5GB13_9RHOB|nr:Lrp/AsnC family transcriptional regulator [Pelagovum pacificum]QQA42063.1 Lrp/AsnC family transcriptional regulator [Pelagovum pacificum]TNY31152.1 Lrp/AsnC family transcriptional regulator [Pelagovum pacificum]